MTRAVGLSFPILVVAAATAGVAARGQEGPLKAETTQEAPPAALAGPIKEVLQTHAIRVVDGQGKPLARIWLRKSIPGSSKPGGPKGAVLYPFLAEGELLGAVEYVSQGHDYRDQTIAPGLYTLRYGLQPVNGDHLGVSLYRDYALLISAAKDEGVAEVPKKDLEKRSAEAAQSNHPAVLLLTSAPTGGKAGETGVCHDEEKNLWGVVLPLSLSVKGEDAPVPASVQLIVVGAAMT
jgi:hypothetical protein